MPVCGVWGVGCSAGETVVVRIAFVCLGNICRSPAAEAIARARLLAAGLDGDVSVESFGTAGWYEGAGAHHQTMASLRRAGYVFEHRARQIRQEHVGELDMVLALDRSNFADVVALVGTDADAVGKVRLAREFDALGSLPPELEVPDPWGHGDDDFDHVVEMLERVADGVVGYSREVLR